MIFINAPVWLRGLVFWFFILNGFLRPVVAKSVLLWRYWQASQALPTHASWKAKAKD